MTSLARHIVECSKVALQLSDDVVQCILGNRRVTAVAVEKGFVLFEIAQHIGLEIGTRSHVHDVEDRDECVVVRKSRVGRHQFTQAAEQVLEPQVGACALVERVLVQDHAAGSNR